MPISIREVAARAGVSLGTVSKVLNNSTGAQLADGTRDRVRHAARELGYHPSAVARALVRRQTDTLGVIFPGAGSPQIRGGFFSVVFNALLDAAHQVGQDVTVLTGRTWHNAERSMPEFRDGRCDGYIVFFQFPGSDLIPAFLDSKIPFVLVNDCGDDPRLSCVDVDNVFSARTATEYLLSLGHTRIAHIGGDVPDAPVAGRLRGYREVLCETGITPDPRLAPPGTYYGDSVADRVTTLMGLPRGERPTAFFCGADGIAFGVLRTLARLGIRVPEEVSVIGHDDLPEAEQEHPSLTTMRQPFDEIGATTVSELLAVVRNRENRGVKTFLPTELIVRGSTAPPPASD